MYQRSPRRSAKRTHSPSSSPENPSTFPTIVRPFPSPPSLYLTFCPVGDAYNFTSTGAGSYTISPSTLFHYLDASGAPVTVRAPSSTSKLTLSGSLVSTSYSARTAAQAKITYGSCTAARKTQIARASQSALALATGAYTKLKSAGANTARYRTWFGAYTSANRNTVYSHYSLIIQSGFSNFKYDCTCTDSGTFA